MTFADLFSNDAEPLRNPDQGAGTSVLERPETKESPVRDDGGDADRFAHYVSKDRIAESRATGRPVVALCGKVWVPKHDPSKYPVCPDCKRIYEEMTRCAAAGYTLAPLSEGSCRRRRLRGVTGGPGRPTLSLTTFDGSRQREPSMDYFA